jgi:hypothetical protein
MNTYSKARVGLSLHGVLLENFIGVAFQVVGQWLQRNLQVVVEWTLERLSVIEGRPACPKVTHIVNVSVENQLKAQAFTPKTMKRDKPRR